jgi:hypothetical protein
MPIQFYIIALFSFVRIATDQPTTVVADHQAMNYYT